MRSKPFLINHFVGVLKPLVKHATIFTLSLNTILIDLSKVQGLLVCIGHMVFCVATGNDYLAKNLKFHVTQRFPFLSFLHYMTHHFGIDKYK